MLLRLSPLLRTLTNTHTHTKRTSTRIHISHHKHSQTIKDGQVLLRLSHIFAAGEDATWAQAVQIDLGTLFVDYSISAIVETQLTANQPLSQINRMQWTSTSSVNGPSVAFDPHPINSIGDGLMITLHPLQIRTFVVTLIRN